MNVFSLAYLGVLLVASAAPLHASDAGLTEWKFDVFLDDERLGTHEVQMRQSESEKEIVTRASFEYTILFIPVYTYEHTTTETWQGDCVRTIQSRTDDNGDEYFIDAKSSEQGFLIETKEGSARLDDCIRTYAYWDRELLKTDRLLNTQNGKHQQSMFTDQGEKPLQFNGREIPARCVELDTEEGKILLWYDENDRWIALQSEVESGSTIRYIATDLVNDGDNGEAS